MFKSFKALVGSVVSNLVDRGVSLVFGAAPSKDVTAPAPVATPVVASAPVVPAVAPAPLKAAEPVPASTAAELPLCSRCKKAHVRKEAHTMCGPCHKTFSEEERAAKAVAPTASTAPAIQPAAKKFPSKAERDAQRKLEDERLAKGLCAQCGSSHTLPNRKKPGTKHPLCLNCLEQVRPEIAASIRESEARKAEIASTKSCDAADCTSGQRLPHGTKFCNQCLVAAAPKTDHTSTPAAKPAVTGPTVYSCKCRQAAVKNRGDLCEICQKEARYYADPPVAVKSVPAPVVVKTDKKPVVAKPVLKTAAKTAPVAAKPAVQPVAAKTTPKPAEPPLKDQLARAQKEVREAFLCGALPPSNEVLKKYFDGHDTIVIGDVVLSGKMVIVKFSFKEHNTTVTFCDERLLVKSEKRSTPVQAPTETKKESSSKPSAEDRAAAKKAAKHGGQSAADAA